ncbi:ABC transporter ATP-binding protein [Serinibacter arcticus]|uniref:ABC transporter ATP-binding protein n=1 Tax=Serinibacter arcticus TaxID=1655435 RepID=A0A2U1ZUT5_9MICO|nr:ABC transporter ATP-binding protein [Serinibacter arcticus]PWD50734.1 ABC transporter ATP-binding protein [Serinibacter arcticus]
MNREPATAVAPVLEIDDLHVAFATPAGRVQAVRGVSLTLAPGETLAVVGESGSGKSVTARAVLGLLGPSGVVESGSVRFRGTPLTGASERQLRRVRGNEIAMVFQDPMTALDPTVPVGRQVSEPLRIHRGISRRAADAAAVRLLESVGIENAAERRRQFPHQFSGGQRQRICIATALACDPAILIADEPTTALDVVVQAQVLDLLAGLRGSASTSVIFITHDLGVVASIADRVAVMYAGRIVEIGTTTEIFLNPQHPYTWGLLASLPTGTADRLHEIPGTPPDMLRPPPGDAFAARNPDARQIDLEVQPPLIEVSPTHAAATWLLAEGAPEAPVPPEIAARHARFRERADRTTIGPTPGPTTDRTVEP